jgi:hypothetical protein
MFDPLSLFDHSELEVVIDKHIFEVLDDEYITGLIAETNTDGWDVNGFEIVKVSLPECDPEDFKIDVEFIFDLEGEQREDRAYLGTRIDGTAIATLDLHNGTVEISVIDAENVDQRQKDEEYWREQSEEDARRRETLRGCPAVNVSSFRPFSNFAGGESVVRLVFYYDAKLVDFLKSLLRYARRETGGKGGWLKDRGSWFVERKAWPIVHQELTAAGCSFIGDPEKEIGS